MTFYIGEPDGAHVAVATARTDAPIYPGGSLSVSASFTPTPEQTEGELAFFARVDDVGDGTGENNECVETNNILDGLYECSVIE